MDARRLKITADHRTSLIVDPRRRQDSAARALVAGAPAGAGRAGRRQRPFQRRPAERHLDMSLPVRCIIRTDSPPYLPTIYNNDFHIFQSPGYVAIAPEMIHSARIIPLDGRPHLGNEPASVAGRHARPLGRQHAGGRDDEFPNRRRRGLSGRESRRRYKITERFTRVDADTLNYEFTIEDPTTWTRPWTARIPWNKDRSGRADVRVRVPRRQLRHRPLPDGRARAREARRDCCPRPTAARPERGDAMRTTSIVVVACRARRRWRGAARRITPSPPSSTRTSRSSSRARSRRCSGSIRTRGFTST